MSNCYKCPHQAEIDRLRKICLACKSGESDCGLSNKGRSHVSMDAAADGAQVLAKGKVAPTFRTAAAAEQYSLYLDRVAEYDPLEAYCRRIANAFAELNFDEGGMVCEMLQGKSIADIVRMRGGSFQGWHQKWQKILRRNPGWKAIVQSGLIGSGVGRKKAKKGERQEDLPGFEETGKTKKGE